MSAQRILIVEDEPSIADNIVFALKTEGFAPHWCRTGSEAKAAWDAQQPDLVVLDVGLPDTSGFDLCKYWRQHSDVPIIFLTARDSEIDKVVGLEIGGDDYVVKPFSPRELTARVRARLRNRQPTPSSSASALVLDEPRQCASLGGAELNLTRYEFRLLSVLHGAPGRVFSRDQLLDLVWSDPTAAFDRTVDTHVKTLRQKLRVAGERVNPIRTHRGVGYSFDPEGL